MVQSDGIEPSTHRFSVYCSTNWANSGFKMVGPVGNAPTKHKAEDLQSSGLSYHPQTHIKIERFYFCWLTTMSPSIKPGGKENHKEPEIKI